MRILQNVLDVFLEIAVGLYIIGCFLFALCEVGICKLIESIKK